MNAQRSELIKYDESRFVDVPDIMRCAICLDVLYEPMECSKCECLYCKECTESSDRTNGKCPSCRCRSAWKKINRIVRENFYNKLKLKCCNSPACITTPTIVDIEKHEKECPFGEMECSLCSIKVTRGTYSAHQLEICNKRKVECEYCHEYVVFDELIGHKRAICQDIPRSCFHCKLTMTFKTKDAHLAICLELPITCSLVNCKNKSEKCGKEFPRKDLCNHTTFECKYRNMNCEHCSNDVQFFCLDSHYQTECKKFVHSCNLCQANYTLSDNHAGSCPMVSVQCEMKGCPKFVLRKNYDTHVKDCKHRLVDCMHCKQSVKLCDIKNHNGRCTYYPIDCRFCNTTVARKEIKSHISGCPNVEVYCEVEGCEHICMRKDLDSHYADPVIAVKHIKHMLAIVEQTNQKLKNCEQRNKKIIEQKDQIIEQNNQIIEQNNQRIVQYNQRIVQNNQRIEQKDQYIVELEQQLYDGENNCSCNAYRARSPEEYGYPYSSDSD